MPGTGNALCSVRARARVFELPAKAKARWQGGCSEFIVLVANVLGNRRQGAKFKSGGLRFMVYELEEAKCEEPPRRDSSSTDMYSTSRSLGYGSGRWIIGCQ